MTDHSIAIRAQGLSKRYRIGGARRAAGRTFREALVEKAAAPFHRVRSLLAGEPINADAESELWALKDVSFELERGHVLGVIGRNGAGKSTLLKVLSRITEPTRGQAEIYGRLGSLLEVGTGFHPELSGRENTYLNGAILGMGRREIDAKLDEIVAFAEIERFLDTPVKHYSSGMYLRLAFAVAAHLETEILLVDEVLAVGDANFQKRCLGKMEDLSRAGRTVLFVSHNLAAVQRLCDSVLVLQSGGLLARENPSAAVARYLGIGGEEQSELRDVLETPFISIERMTLLVDGQPSTGTIDAESCATVEIDYQVHQKIPALLLGVDILSNNGEGVLRTYDYEEAGLPREPGRYRSVLELPLPMLRAMTYRVELLVARHRQSWLCRGGPGFTINIDRVAKDDIHDAGVVRVDSAWAFDRLP